jgi:hypothetical protein
LIIARPPQPYNWSPCDALWLICLCTLKSWETHQARCKPKHIRDRRA